MARRVLMAEVGVKGTDVRLDRCCEGGLEQQVIDGGGCATMNEKSQRLESSG